MEISVSSNSVTITGSIKSVGDFQSIKSAVDSLKTSYKSINIDIKDSISITSSVIGYFNKLVLKDNMEIHMNVGKEQLFSLMDELNLSQVFNLKKS